MKIKDCPLVLNKDIQVWFMMAGNMGNCNVSFSHAAAEFNRDINMLVICYPIDEKDEVETMYINLDRLIYMKVNDSELPMGVEAI